MTTNVAISVEKLSFFLRSRTKDITVALSIDGTNSNLCLT